MKRAFLVSVAASCILALTALSASAQAVTDPAYGYATPTQAAPNAPNAPTEPAAPPTYTDPNAQVQQPSPPAEPAPADPLSAAPAAPSPQAETAPVPDQPQLAQSCASTSGEIFFETASDDLNAQSQQALIQSAATLRNCRSAEIVVAGHADARGSEDYNLALSERRAETVRDLLVAQGVQATLIRVEAVGEADATGDLQRDRRVELEVRTVSAALPETAPAL